MRLNQIEDTADATIAWENIPLPEDLLQFSVENAVAVYTKYPTILDDVNNARGERSNFFEQG